MMHLPTRTGLRLRPKRHPPIAATTSIQKSSDSPQRPASATMRRQRQASGSRNIARSCRDAANHRQCRHLCQGGCHSASRFSQRPESPLRCPIRPGHPSSRCRRRKRQSGLRCSRWLLNQSKRCRRINNTVPWAMAAQRDGETKRSPPKGQNEDRKNEDGLWLRMRFQPMN